MRGLGVAGAVGEVEARSADGRKRAYHLSSWRVREPEGPRGESERRLYLV